MKERFLAFIDALRQAGVTPSLSESLDAAAGIAALGIERPVFRECLAATLVKDHTDRGTFDDVFDRYFALPDRGRAMRRKAPAMHEGEGAGGDGTGAGRLQRHEGTSGGQEKRSERRLGEDRQVSSAARLPANRRALLSLPFRDMDPGEVEAIRELVKELSQRFRNRRSRRVRRAKRGRLDIRHTIRRALSRGGVPIELLRRHPRPGKSDLVALVDLSFSTVTAAEFLLALLKPARAYFRRVTLLAYVDRPVELSVEHGHIVPHEPLDLNARSDFGRVLQHLADRYELTLGRNAVLLILGDARNNRRPPRADILRRLHRRVRSVVWLNPERPERWNSGDSVMATYEQHIDVLLAAFNMHTLRIALTRLVKIGL